ncbi:hypothetical protein Tco_0537154 [Tanacetum coccineum]
MRDRHSKDSSSNEIQKFESTVMPFRSTEEHGSSCEVSVGSHKEGKSLYAKFCKVEFWLEEVHSSWSLELGTSGSGLTKRRTITLGRHGLGDCVVDGKSKRMIQTLEDIMRAYVIDFGGSYKLSIRCAPFEALYGRKLMPILWAE